MYQGDVKSKFFEDTTAGTTANVVAAGTTSAPTILVTSFGTNTARQLSVTTAGAGDGTKTVTITGEDVNGDDLTEVITLPASATTTNGSEYFLNISTIVGSATFAANVSVGITDSVGGVIFAGRTRVRQMQVNSGGTAGNVEVKDGSLTGTTGITVRTTATAEDNTTINIPQDGVLFKTGAFIVFDQANCHAATVYFDG